MKGGAEKLKKKQHQPWFDAEENFVFTSFQVTQNLVSVFIEAQFLCNNKDKTCLITSYPYFLFPVPALITFGERIEKNFISYFI